MTSSGRFIPEIDGLRFVAIGSVFVYHLGGYVAAKAHAPFRSDPSEGLLADILIHGNLGVQLFFAISGFILALPFASHHLRGTAAVGLRPYFMRRLTRLEPPYIVSMLLFFALRVIYVGDSAEALTPHLGASLAYVHNLVYGAGSVINGVAWSLEVEVQFYILVPALAAVFAIRDRGARRLTIVGLIGLAIALQWVLIPPDAARIRLTVLNHIQFFLVGFLLADVYLSDWKAAPARSARWDLVTLAGWPTLLLALQSNAGERVVFPLLIFVLYCAAFRGVWSSRLFSNRWITTIGGMCYTIYLLHYPLISFVGRHTADYRITDRFGGELAWQFLLVTPVVLLVCTVFFALIERPCMQRDWPQRLLATGRRVVGGTSPG